MTGVPSLIPSYCLFHFFKSYFTSASNFCVIGQTPWPDVVQLFQPNEATQILLPDSANCLSVQAFLRMCNLNYEVISKPNAEFMSPSGNLIVIRLYII